jgi:2-polyprenyl-3-methyl-5-hydroxy-6-metoxy-1,4-benzoquinol methylase
MYREDELQWPHQVRRDPLKGATLPVRLQHHPELALLEVPQAAVDKPARSRAGAGSEIVLLDQDRSQSAHRRVTGDSSPVDATPDDEEIRWLRGELLQRRAFRGPLTMTLCPVTRATRPSTWFLWHAHVIRPGARVLDLACGQGRHSLAAAALGAEVVGVDRDAAKLATARERAAAANLTVDWREVDLEAPWPELGNFDAVLVFNYLDRASMPRILGLVAPGGRLIMETFLEAQREAGWGPTSERHLLRPGELARLVGPLTVVHGREVFETVDAERWRAVASVIAVRSKK